MLTRRTLIGTLAAATALPTGAHADRRTAHHHTFTDIDGAPLPLSRFSGDALMVVNTASLCGFTYQYDGLQALYDRYRARGFTLVAVPSDDFAGQELDTEKEVKEFCEVNFNLDFPMTGITRVKGRDAHPFYRWAALELGADNTPQWNFHKYLIDGQGNLVAAFPTRIEPQDPRIRTAIENLISPDQTG